MKRRNPIFSVLITNYNYGKYLGEAVRSVLKQTFSDFEIVLVDDGSTDNSPAVIRKLVKTDKRIRAFRQPNGGQAAAFNRAFAKSRGKLLCFLDSDDTWMPRKLEWTERVFAEAKDVALVQHNMYILRNRKRERLYNIFHMVSGSTIEQLATLRQDNFFMPCSSMCIPRRIMQKVMPIPEEIRICADAYLYRTVMAHGKLFSLDLPLASYRVHGENYWVENPERDNDMISRVVIPHVLDYYRRHGIKNVAQCIQGSNGRKAINQEGLMIAYLVLERIKQLKDSYAKIAVYGAGAHTRWLMELLVKTGIYPDLMPSIVAIMDDQAERCQPIGTFNIQTPLSVNPDSFNAVILSTDCFQTAMREQLQTVFPNPRFVVEDLYHGLPEGPYPKVNPSQFCRLNEIPSSNFCSRESMIISQWVMEQLRRLKQKHARIALYGAGAHTRWLAEMMKQAEPSSNLFSSVKVIMDDQSEHRAPIGNLPIVSPLAVSPDQFDVIILSSDCHQKTMRDRLKIIFSSSQIPIIDLYEGLPPGPYPKPDIKSIFSKHVNCKTPLGNDTSGNHHEKNNEIRKDAETRLRVLGEETIREIIRQIDANDEKNNFRWESYSAAILASLQTARVFVDCGAEFGFYIYLALKRYPSCRVIAFEPEPVRFQLLNNFFGNYENLTILPCALADHVGEITVYKPNDNASCTIDRNLSQYDNIRVNGTTVKATTLDAILENMPVDVIKMDIEGAEVLALAGMAGILMVQRPLIYMEVHPKYITSIRSDGLEFMTRKLHHAHYTIFGNAGPSRNLSGRIALVPNEHAATYKF